MGDICFLLVPFPNWIQNIRFLFISLLSHLKNCLLHLFSPCVCFILHFYFHWWIFLFFFLFNVVELFHISGIVFFFTCPISKLDQNRSIFELFPCFLIYKLSITFIVSFYKWSIVCIFLYVFYFLLYFVLLSLLKQVPIFGSFFIVEFFHICVCDSVFCPILFPNSITVRLNLIYFHDFLFT